jgi:hypothetical protein
MSEKEQHLQQLTDIREMMEQSSRFISLSGLSGIFAGVFAIAGALLAKIHLGKGLSELHTIYTTRYIDLLNMESVTFLLVDASIVLALALGFGIFFTTRKAKQKGLPVWDKQAKRLLISLAIPLATGGLFCLMLLIHNVIFLIAPATLVFYGLALVNASKYTLSDIQYLGYAEIILGLLGAFFLGYGFISWVAGFGLLHIIYGSWMYIKYER